MKYLLLILIFLSFTSASIAQQGDFVTQKKLSRITAKEENSRGRIKKIILPASLFTYGIIFSQIKTLNKPDNEIARYEQQHFPNKTKIDNYLQYAPAVATLGLDAFGIKGKHNFGQKVILYALSETIETGITEALKYSFRRMRPDNSTRNAFPSGHTGTAFAAAEFMRMEYGGRSPWYSIAGYTVAGATGLLRVYNNRHWFSDVVAGAGVGILSTRFAYWAYPILKKIIVNKKDFSFFTTPFYDGYSGGLKMVVLQRM